MFNLAIKNKIFPDKLKDSVIRNVISQVENCRPINVVNSIFKYNILKTFGNQCAQQKHESLPGTSTVTNLCVLTVTASGAINNRSQLDEIMTDCDISLG